MIKQRAVFLDRDGTINEEVGYLSNLDQLSIIPEAFEAVRLMNRRGFQVIVITNQSGIGRGYFDEAVVEGIHNHMRAVFLAEGAVIDYFYYCPHHPTKGRGVYLLACSCRKPEPGMLIRAAAERNIDLPSSYMIGDTLKDVLAGKRAGCKGILVETGYGRDADTTETIPDYTAKDILDATLWILKDMDDECENGASS
ncbi:MAG: Histidine biosynthesis bifunctional protein HisB [Syntrophus sp. SKADARSKE-3]|nr:Histidine biosynthesis bifunctional protein HisB [Syntrophus sp. SKADARSKE-3]